MALPVVTAWGHGAEAHGVTGVVVGAVRGLIDGEVGGGFAGLNIAQPLDRIIIETFAALMAHILGQTVNHEPQGNIYGTLHQHRIAARSGGGKRAVEVIAVTQVRGYLLHCGGFGCQADVVVLGYLLKLVVVAHTAVVVEGQEHGREVLRGEASKIAISRAFSAERPGSLF